MVPWTHTSPPPKRHLDRFNRFCTAHPCAQIADLSSIAAANGFVRPLPDLIHGFLAPRVSNPNGISISYHGAIIRQGAAWRHRLACAGEAACRSAVKWYRRRQMTTYARKHNNTGPYTMCRRASKNKIPISSWPAPFREFTRSIWGMQWGSKDSRCM